MFEKIRDLIVEEVGVDEEQVTMDASFKNDLNIDSLDLFEMVMTLEEEFDVEIPSEDLENIDTVGDLIQYIESHQE
ncbi:MAG: acyl carrier protein [Clostridiales bacterium]|uniref:Acyl carrier protein n=1 Tax=Candidatus Anaerobutyricum stercoripullorum TaxID=2838456 RepID=A0A9D1X420_9FIRM|nr:acyl carrier protein [Clostridiales bacterium]HIX72379.1 acyl carrier protein [Candidatus Anaerobutyricum stercoripullorum]